MSPREVEIYLDENTPEKSEMGLTQEAIERMETKKARLRAKGIKVG